MQTADINTFQWTCTYGGLQNGFHCTLLPPLSHCFVEVQISVAVAKFRRIELQIGVAVAKFRRNEVQ
jgi:hypothetical protein